MVFYFSEKNEAIFCGSGLQIYAGGDVIGRKWMIWEYIKTNIWHEPALLLLSEQMHPTIPAVEHENRAQNGESTVQHHIGSSLQPRADV